MDPHLLAGPIRALSESLPAWLEAKLGSSAAPFQAQDAAQPGSEYYRRVALAFVLRSAAKRVFPELDWGALQHELPGWFAELRAGLPSAWVPELERELEERIAAQLGSETLSLAFQDDTSLGWIYQYWSDAERAAIDARLDAQHKLKAHEIATKTQVFTDRYMVDWLLQNSLGPLWQGMCELNGWQPRTTEGWKYLQPGPPVPAPSHAAQPARLSELKLLDPACGTGHFLIIAFDYLLALYREEAEHLGCERNDREIVESILSNNLHGIDLDGGAVRVAALGLFLKARAVARDAQPGTLHLASTDFGPALRRAPHSDPARQELDRVLPLAARSARSNVHSASDRLTQQLCDATYLGTLLKLEVELDRLLAVSSTQHAQQPAGLRGLAETALRRFLGEHTSSRELGVLLSPAQASVGLRFFELTRQKQYHVVTGNPPYFGTQSMADASYLDRLYPDSRENLCTALLDRAMDLVKPGGVLAFVTQRNWFYVRQLQYFRRRMLSTYAPLRLADLELGGFASLKTVDGMLWVAREGPPASCWVVRAPEAEPSDKARSLAFPKETYSTEPALLAKLPGSPFVYRWSRAFVERYLSEPLLGERFPVRVGMKTSDNCRFVRYPWELPVSAALRAVQQPQGADWVPYIKGAEGKVWIEPLSHLVWWRELGLEIRIALEHAYGQKPQAEKYFFKRGVAFNTIGRSFVARVHRYPSLFDVAGSSVFPEHLAQTVCLLNSDFARQIVEALNPTINFQVGDVARIPLREDPEASTLFAILEEAFEEHERSQETCFRFERPLPSRWRSAQAYVRAAVNRAEGTALPTYTPVFDPPAPEALFSYAVGVALGRFGRQGEGLLDAPASDALPHGILFVGQAGYDSLSHPAARELEGAFRTFLEREPAADVVPDARRAKSRWRDMREFLRRDFFELHRRLYQNRPIYLPLASARGQYVAFISIHRFSADTLERLLTEHLEPERLRLTREPPEQPQRERLLEELSTWAQQIETLAQRGPPAPNSQVPDRETDAPFRWEPSDGVLVNSAALWPALAPLWSEPRKAWLQLASRSGPKGGHFDWSKTARRYFPKRVAEACAVDPVVASAHGELAKHHPQLAARWQREIAKLAAAGPRPIEDCFGPLSEEPRPTHIEGRSPAS